MFTYSKFEHDYNLSPFKYIEPISNEYTVEVNGVEVPVYTCRVSKISFNRMWPGHQRSCDQTTIVSFVNIISDEPLSFKVKPLFDYERVLIKPFSKNIAFDNKNGEISFKLGENGQYVLTCDDFTHALYIFNSPEIAAPEKEEVTYYFGPGVHMPGKITLCDNESIYVDKDALVFGCIYAENAKNIHIFGNGIFDDSGEGRIHARCYENFTVGNIKFYDCENIKIEGVLFRDSAVWCVNLFHCFNVEIDNIKVFGQWRYNTDGIDIVNSQNITVKNSFVHSFDDTLVVKGIDRYADTDNKNILFENCVVWCDWGNTLEIGLETLCREYKNITFRNIDILRACNNALDIANGDSAEVNNILFENINVEYNVFDSPAVHQVTEDTPYAPDRETQIANIINFRNYLFRQPGMYGHIPPMPEKYAKGNWDVGMIRDVVVRGVNVYYDEKILEKDGKCCAKVIVKSVRDNITLKNISISGVKINGESIDKDYPFLEIANAENVTFEK